MERVSVEERIRRAEERYYRTKESINAKDNIYKSPRSDEKNINNQNKNLKDINNKIKRKIYKKLVVNICICLMIYGAFYQITINQNMFSEDFTNKAKEILDKDINFLHMFSTIKSNINTFFNQLELQSDTNKENQNTNTENNTNNENQNNNTENGTNNESSNNSTENNESVNNLDNIQNNNENIGGAVEGENNIDGTEQNVNTVSENSNEQTENNEEIVELSQMEKDANYIKENVSIIKPVNGTISSKYGLRNPTTPSVPKDHKGTDIAAVTGTKIVSATDGKVILKSSEGDYGKHLKIQIGEVVLIYAHCNDLYVNEGDEIKQGQEIAEVGSTGNTTGPHLHFEIRYQNRYVDPEMILNLS